MGKFLIYNVDGLTLPVEAEPGLFFTFECLESECGKRVIIEGEIVPVPEETFNTALDRVVKENPEFKAIEKIRVRKYLFMGKVNGREVTLPVEDLSDFAKRYIEGLDYFVLLSGK